ncbi:MAG: DUF4265 domain-containing protein [Pyrinomonadaceae bacterium]
MSDNTFTVYGDYYVEIWFPVEPDSDGFPSDIRWEQLMASPVVEDENFFQLESIPFYLKNVSRGDIVEALERPGNELDGVSRFEFEKVICRGGHNTYRLLLKMTHVDDPSYTENELLSLGLCVESQFGDFFAVDVPNSVDQGAIDAFLISGVKSERWGMQDGFINEDSVQILK